MKINKCRSCKSKNLIKIYSLGKQTLTGIFPPQKKARITKGDLSMIICNHCKLLQLEHNFNANEMYGDNYGYMSSLNKSSFSKILFSYFPTLILFLSVFNEHDFNYLKIEFFSFNFVYILNIFKL